MLREFEFSRKNPKDTLAGTILENPTKSERIRKNPRNSKRIRKYMEQYDNVQESWREFERTKNRIRMNTKKSEIPSESGKIRKKLTKCKNPTELEIIRANPRKYEKYKKIGKSGKNLENLEKSGRNRNSY